MMRSCDTDKPCLHLVYEMWDNMIIEVETIIFGNEQNSDESCFRNVVRKVLEDRWSKSNTPSHCLAHSLNPMCTTEDWRREHPHLTTPDHDPEITKMRKFCIKRLFPDVDTRIAVTLEFANFSGCFEEFGGEYSIRDRSNLDPLKWWVDYGIGAPHL
ncbi:hypothetical protein ACS0TY_015273 [Phlomoides rotata]